jgi:predicted PurR-regulated permease PerM
MRDALGTSPLPELPVGPPTAASAWQPAITLALVGGGIVALYFGQAILVPLALAALLSFALAPLVARLRRWGLPRVPAVLATVLLAFAGIGGFGLLVGGQLAQLADNLPAYQQNIRAKLRSLQAATPSGGLLEQASDMLHELGQELQQAQEQQPTGRGGAPSGGAGKVTIERATDEPITVRVEAPALTPLEVIKTVAVPLLAPVGTAGIVVVFVVFMLLEREDLRDRLIRLVGGGNLHQTTEALNEAGRRVSRFLLMQLVVNATYGVPIGIGLWLIGIPNALLWGVLATVLRFVPYVGPFIAALFPIAIAVAVAPGWGLVFWTIALFLALELVSNNVVEPWLYGASTGVSTVAILVAAIFWTTLWGPVGLLLSTPLTVCLAVLGRYVPPLGFLDVLLGSEPVLTPPERFYQRMLAGDPEEGEEIAEAFLEGRPLAAFYDEVALPALRLAEADRRRKVLVGERRALVTESLVKVVAELADHEDPDDGDGVEGDGREVPPLAWTGKPVLCVAGRTGLDRAAAAMLAQLLERRGLGARVLPSDAIGPERIADVDLGGVELVCLSYLGPTAVAHARQACRRLRRRALPGARILVGLWDGQLDQAKDSDPAGSMGANLTATSFAQAVERIERLAATPSGPANGA